MRDSVITWLVSNWMPALTFVAGVAITSILNTFFSYRANRALEDLRSDLSKQGELFKRDLKVRDEEISAFRNAALGGFGTRSSILMQRRLTAVERIWSSVVDLAPFLTAAKMTSAIKFEEAIRIASQQNSEGEKVRKFADTYWTALKLDGVKFKESPDKERPFVTETLWARFSLYRSIAHLPANYLAAMKAGVPSEVIKQPTPILEAAKNVLPHYSQFFNDCGVAGLIEIIDEVRDLVLNEIRDTLSGKSMDADHIAEANRTIAEIRKFDEAINPAPKIPNELIRKESIERH